MTVYLHPDFCTSPRKVDEVERATGRVAVICGGRVELRAPADRMPAARRRKKARGRK